MFSLSWVFNRLLTRIAKTILRASIVLYQMPIYQPNLTSDASALIELIKGHC